MIGLYSIERGKVARVAFCWLLARLAPSIASVVFIIVNNIRQRLDEMEYHGNSFGNAVNI